MQQLKYKEIRPEEKVIREMKIYIAYNGSMVIIDQMGTKHMFTPWETQRIGTAWYKFVQKKDEGLIY